MEKELPGNSLVEHLSGLWGTLCKSIHHYYSEDTFANEFNDNLEIIDFKFIKGNPFMICFIKQRDLIKQILDSNHLPLAIVDVKLGILY